MLLRVALCQRGRFDAPQVSPAVPRPCPPPCASPPARHRARKTSPIACGVSDGGGQVVTGTHLRDTFDGDHLYALFTAAHPSRRDAPGRRPVSRSKERPSRSQTLARDAQLARGLQVRLEAAPSEEERQRFLAAPGGERWCRSGRGREPRPSKACVARSLEQSQSRPQPRRPGGPPGGRAERPGAVVHHPLPCPRSRAGLRPLPDWSRGTAPSSARSFEYAVVRADDGGEIYAGPFQRP